VADRPRELPSAEEEVRLLREYLRDLESILQSIVFDPYGIVPGRHHAALQRAWPDVEGRFEQLQKGLTGEMHSSLLGVGLSGAMLAFELSIFYHARDELLDRAPWLLPIYWPPSPAPIPSIVYPGYPEPKSAEPRKGKRWLRWVRRLAGHFLKSGDVILGSLGKIPVLGLPAEGIKQYKEGVEQAAAVTEAIAMPPAE
jgi:hypothetical protein